jgi:hypothetical protein
MALARSAYERQRTHLGDTHEMTVAARARVDEIASLPMAARHAAIVARQAK